MAQKSTKQATKPRPEGSRATNGAGPEESPPAETNGAQPQGPRIPRREQWVDLPAEYPGFKIKIWINYPQRLYDQIFDDDIDEAERYEVLRKILLQHNGWLDEEGEPLPGAQEDGFWESLPSELIAVLIVTIREAVYILPNSQAGRKRS